MLIELFDKFAKELEYLKGTSRLTISSYRYAVKRYILTCGDVMPNKEQLSNYVIAMREKGLSTTTCNISIRSFNSFLTWLAENEHCPKMRMKQMKEEKKTIPDIPIEVLKKLMNYKPKTKVEKRIWALTMVLMDTGCRIDEILTLKRSRIDLDNCLMEVTGKGSKNRIIPLSNEIRRVLHNHLKSHTNELVFGTRDGNKVTYFNMRRDFFNLCDSLKIERIPFHRLRHNYALNFVRGGGDVFSLKRILGHASLQTTMVYVNSNTEDLKLIHNKTSILSRLR